MRWSVRTGIFAAALAGLALAGCGSSGGSGSAADGPTTTKADSSTTAADGKGCELVTLDQVKAQFPKYAIDKAETTTVEGATAACEFTGKPAAGGMGEYTDATTVTIGVGTYDADAGPAAYQAILDDDGFEQDAGGLTIAVGDGKSVAKLADGTYAFSTIASPELPDPGNDQTIELLELLASNQ